MRRLLMVLSLIGIAGTAIATVSTTNVGSLSPKLTVTPPADPGTRITGDTIGDPFICPQPYGEVSGTTVGFGNDYDEVCPYSGSTSPDVVYRYTPVANMTVCFDLCFSSYDTKLYVYQDAWTPGAPHACNDDYWFAAPCYTYTSFVNVPVQLGHTYYIVIDGYGGQSGAYSMSFGDSGCVPITGACCDAGGACTITWEPGCAGTWQGIDTVCVPNPCPPPPPPPPVPCFPEALLEGEPTCGDNYVDTYNGGCNSTPVIWQAVVPQAAGCATMCGHSCTYLLYGASNRDTDWFSSNSAGGTVIGTVSAEFPVMIALFYANTTDCSGILYTYALGAAYTPTSVSYSVAAGLPVGFFIANQSFSGYPAELGYVLNMCNIQTPPPPPGACCNAAGACIVTTPKNCAFMGGTFQGDPACTPTTCIPVPTERKSWGAVKSLYR